MNTASELVGVYVQVPANLRKRFREFCKAAGEEFTSEVRLALERHLAKPPSRKERLAAQAFAVPVKKKGRPRKPVK